MELFWLVLAIGSAGWVIWQSTQNGWAVSRHMAWIPLICTAMFFYRRFTRRKMAQWAQRKAQEEGRATDRQG